MFVQVLHFEMLLTFCIEN